MNNQDRQIIKDVWSRNINEPFSIAVLAKHAKQEGGIDMNGLAIKNICDLFDGRYEGEWYEVQFSFNEILPLFWVITESGTKPLKSHHVLICILALLMLADARDIGARDIGQHTGNIIRTFSIIKDQLTPHEFMHLQKRIFDPDILTTI